MTDREPWRQRMWDTIREVITLTEGGFSVDEDEVIDELLDDLKGVGYRVVRLQEGIGPEMKVGWDALLAEEL